MQTISPKFLYYKDDDFQIEYQICDTKTIGIHSDVYNFSPRVARKGYLVFSRMEQDFRSQGIELIFTISPNPKFCEMFGGKSIRKIMYGNKECEVLIWEQH